MQLAKSKDMSIRSALACNTNVSPDAQNILAQDELFSVRWSLFNNPNCTQDALNALMSMA